MIAEKKARLALATVDSNEYVVPWSGAIMLQGKKAWIEREDGTWALVAQ